MNVCSHTRNNRIWNDCIRGDIGDDNDTNDGYVDGGGDNDRLMIIVIF